MSSSRFGKHQRGSPIGDIVELSRPLDVDDRRDFGDFFGADDAPDDRLPPIAVEGFLAALVSGPTVVMPSEWFPIVLGKNGGFETMEQAQRITSLLMRLNNELATSLREAPDTLQLSVADVRGRRSTGACMTWSLGYMQAVNLRMDDWKPIFTVDDFEIIEPIVLLAEAALVTRELRDMRETRKVAKLLEDSVIDAYDFWTEARVSGATARTIYRAEPKIGRNEPCRCGSGKKFKVCCGR